MSGAWAAGVGEGPPHTATLCSWATCEEAGRAAAELRELAERVLPGGSGRAGAWRAICCRRDARALLGAQPPHGLSGVPPELEAFRIFDAAAREVCLWVEARMAWQAGDIPISSVYGAWEGGLPAHELVQDAVAPARTMTLVVSAFNVQGGLGSRRVEGAHEVRIREMVVELHSRGVALAVLSEPRLAPGSLWPSWAGFAYHGERSALPDTVALLVLDEIGRRV